jgi:hypothetical protein
LIKLEPLKENNPPLVAIEEISNPIFRDYP